MMIYPIAAGTNGTTASEEKKSWPEQEELEKLEGKKAIARRTTYSEENKKWEKQIKKASKGRASCGTFSIVIDILSAMSKMMLREC